MFLGIISSIVCLVAISALYLLHPKFGANPSGEKLVLINKSAQFKNGKFHNASHTPDISEGYSTLGVILTFMFKKVPGRLPTSVLPSAKTNLFDLNIKDNVLVWFGHSSYYMQIDGKRILVDPVLSKNAAPLPGMLKSFKGTNVYSVVDIPPIDYLFISHDHYDHVDYPTLVALQEKVSKVICGLGVGAHFERWGYSKNKILEMDWHEEARLDTDFKVYSTPARHFSGRGFKRNMTLWQSYVLETPALKIYIGGDSGYDTHFKDIGEKFGPFDLAILDNGQFDDAWREIHAFPEEVLLASSDLKAKKLFPVHSAKFAMANHSWNEPLARITELNKSHGVPLVTPMIGEVVKLDSTEQSFAQWWVELD